MLWSFSQAQTEPSPRLEKIHGFVQFYPSLAYGSKTIFLERGSCCRRQRDIEQ